MTLLTTISNESINENLSKRWKNAEIYNYIGQVLVSVNPFRGGLVNFPRETMVVTCCRSGYLHR